MYKRDVPKIIEYVESTDNVVDVGAFVLCTIQTPLSRVGSQMEDIRKNGANSKALWGSKRKGYQYLLNHHDDLKTLKNLEISIDSALKKAMEVPGFGLPKASFFLQLLGHDIGCLDSHNLKRYNLPVVITRGKKIVDYIKTVREIQNAEGWWDSWCNYVAGNRMNKSLATGDKVSSYHYECISGDYQ